MADGIVVPETSAFVAGIDMQTAEDDGLSLQEGELRSGDTVVGQHSEHAADRRSTITRQTYEKQEEIRINCSQHHIS